MEDTFLTTISPRGSDDVPANAPSANELRMSAPRHFLEKVRAGLFYKDLLYEIQCFFSACAQKEGALCKTLKYRIIRLPALSKDIVDA